MNHRSLPSVFLASFACCVLAGCSKPPEITHYTAPKDAEIVTWTLPAAWHKTKHNPGMQYAAFATEPGEDTGNVTVSYLLPDAPGAANLLSNVNRWRGQLELPPATPAEVEKQVLNLGQAGKPMQQVDLASADGRRIRAVIVPREDRIWFFKITGSVEQIDAQKEAFDEFVRGTKFIAPAGTALVAAADAHPTPAPKPPTIEHTPPMQHPVASGNGDFAYSLPAGWKVDPTPHAMRMLTATTGGDKPATLIVTRLSTNFGGMLMNINRWRSEVGLPPVEDEAGVQETPVQIGSIAGKLIELDGPGKGGVTPTRSVIARCTSGESVWFFKILGPAESVAGQKDAFAAFLTSVKLP